MCIKITLNIYTEKQKSGALNSYEKYHINSSDDHFLIDKGTMIF